MRISSWLKSWSHSRRLSNLNQKRVPVESLETRSLPAVSVLLIAGELDITSDGNDDIRIQSIGGNVIVETALGGSTLMPFSGLGTTAASSITAITITGSDEENSIDLGNVRVADFTSLTSILVRAGHGEDSLLGSPDFGDSLFGEDGDDTIDGQGGNDALDGGDGRDEIRGGTGLDTILGGDGADDINGGSGDDSVDSGNGADTVTAGDGNDSVYAGNGEDSLIGGLGNDTLNGDGGTDTIQGDDGNDSIFGGELNDSIQGGIGNDTVDGQAGDDTILGELGDDSLRGGAGNDSIVGGDGNDFVNGQSGNDSVVGGNGNDSIFGGTGDDNLLGDGTDFLSIENGNDLIQGQGGKDTIIGGRGADTLDGGIGQDLVASTFTAEVTPPPPPPPPPAPPPPPPVVASNTFPDAVCTNVGTAVGTTNTMTSGNVDGDSIFTIDGFGQLANAFSYDPLGPTGSTRIPDISTTTYISTPGGSRIALGGNTFPQVTGNSLETESSFVDSTYNLDWELCATVQKMFDGTGLQIGSFMTRTYTITNNTTTTANFDIVNFNHMHMWQAFNPTAGNDAGGHILNPGGTELILVSDRVGTPATVAAFLAITGVHGTVPATNRYELNVWPAMETRISNGQPLQDLINGDTDGDEFVDNPDHSVIAFRNVFSIAPGTTSLYTAHTIFGNADPASIGAAPVNVPPVAVADSATSNGGFPVSFDVVSNDSDADGALDYSSIIIETPPANGTAVSLGNGLLTYTPTIGFSGIDTFTYSIADNTGDRSAPITVTITVIGGDATSDLLIGGDDNDTLIGALGNDTINGGAGNDSLDGSLGNDSILGGGGADILLGDLGDDTLNGQGGPDTLDGGEGNDTSVWEGAGSGNDFITDSLGDNTLRVNGNAASNVFSIAQSAERLLTISEAGRFVTLGPTFLRAIVDSGSGNDTITVGNISKVQALALEVHGGAGDDLISAAGSAIGRVRLLLDGGDGVDTIVGGLGDETLTGGAGNDSLHGGAGNDTMLGGTEDDTLVGADGNDSMNGEGGADLLRGGNGDDSMAGGTENDSLNGESGNDTINGNAGSDTVAGGFGNDSLLGEIGADTISGEDGNDSIDGGRNDDSISGGTGDDLIRGNHGNDSINGDDGADTINGGDGNDTISGGIGNDGLAGGDGDDIVSGNADLDTILGGDGRDTLKGGSGNDVILGEDGDDHIDGQGGFDTVAGNQGADTLIDPVAEINEAFTLLDSIRTLLEAT